MLCWVLISDFEGGGGGKEIDLEFRYCKDNTSFNIHPYFPRA